MSGSHDVLTVADAEIGDLASLLNRYRLTLTLQEDGAPITGSYWGEPEAGIVGRTIYVRRDTPIHSLLHECCHIVCMSGQRRAGLVRDAGGDDLEESGVCYLQVLLAGYLRDCGRERLMRDMDAWGYSFRLGSTGNWFRHDSEDAVEFLINHDLMTSQGRPTFRLRA